MLIIYRFLINSVLITLSTLLVVRYMNFPKREYVNEKMEGRVKNYIIIFMVILLAPSGYLFYKMSQKTIFENNATTFITEVVKKEMDGKVTHNFVFSKDSTVSLFCLTDFFALILAFTSEW